MPVIANPYQVPVAQAAPDTRAAFLRRVALLTLGSISITAGAAVVSTGALLALAMAGVTLPWAVQLVLMLGGMYGAQLLGGRMVRSPEPSTRVAGFVLGSGLQGMALGFLLLVAVIVGGSAFSGPWAPLVLPFQAIVLVSLTVAGMVAYLMTGPKNLSMVAGAISALFLPMIALMVLSVVFPVGGWAGVAMSAVFVVVSAGGLLVNLNQVMHRYTTDLALPAAFHLSVGIVVLFWNILSLLLRLTNR